MGIGSQSRQRGECAAVRFKLETFNGYRLSSCRNVQVEYELFISELFPLRYPSRGDRLPPEESSAAIQFYVHVLVVARPGKWDKRIGKILQECAFAHRDRTCLLSGRDTWTTAIEPGSAGGGQLRERTWLYLNLQLKLVSSQYTSRNIMHMYQSSTG